MPITKDVVYKQDPESGAWSVDDSDDDGWEAIDEEEEIDMEEIESEIENEEEISPRNCKKLSINNSDNIRILYSIAQNFLNNTNIENVEKIFSSKIKNNSFFSIELSDKKYSVSEMLIITLSNKLQYLYLEKERLAFPLKTTTVNIIEYKNRGKFNFSKMKIKKDEEKIIL